jgi:uncharacterized membrane protein YdjX (TVP38/TMEM64 family)
MNRGIGIVAAVLILFAISLLVEFGPVSGGVEHFREQLLSFGPWAVLISAGLMIGQAIIAPLPANVVTITNGLVFGPLWGALLSWITTLIGASLCFLLARSLGKPFAEKIVGDSVHKAEKFFKKYGLHAMFVVRIVPFVPFDAVSYVAGVVGVRFSSFLLATSIGIIPSVLVYSFIGSVVPNLYWWILVGMLTISLIGIIVGLVIVTKRTCALPAPAKEALRSRAG